MFIAVTKMAGLPESLQNIVWEYIREFEVVMSLPKLKAVSSLVNKSNQDIIDRYIQVMTCTTEISTYRGLLIVLSLDVLPNGMESHAIITALTTSVIFCWASSSLRWLIFEKQLAKHAKYSAVLNASILFKSLSVCALF